MTEKEVVARWSPQAVGDLAFAGFDVEKGLVDSMALSIALDMDRELIHMAHEDAARSLLLLLVDAEDRLYRFARWAPGAFSRKAQAVCERLRGRIDEATDTLIEIRKRRLR